MDSNEWEFEAIKRRFVYNYQTGNGYSSSCQEADSFVNTG